jgi:hypothetical protein
MTASNLSGYMDDTIGLDGYGALVDTILESVPDLMWPLSIRTYSRMRHDAQLAPILSLYIETIASTTWSVDPAGCRDEVVQLIADDLGLPIKGIDDKPKGARRRGFAWAQHLRTALLDQTFGHMFFEQNWIEQGGRYRLGAVQERMPQTIARIHLNSDGTLQSIEQEGRTTQTRPPVITTADHRLVYYTRQREGSNYFGRSVLRPAFGPWLIRDQMLRVHGESIRRFGMGVPTVSAPAGATPQQIAEAERMATRFRAGERAGAGMPDGYKFTLEGLTGSVPDALAFIQYLDRAMTRQALASILDMATAERGNRSLGDTVLNVLMVALQAIANDHAAVGTSQIVVPLVDANWGEDEPAPQIVCGDVGEQRELSPQDANYLAQWGVITAGDPNLESWARNRYRIPPIDPDYQRPPAAETDDTQPVGGH